MLKPRTNRTARKSLRFESLEDRRLLATLVFGTPVNLGPSVNTAAIENGPSTTADEQSLFFWRSTGINMPTQILEATRTSIDTPFGSAVSAGAAVNVGGFSAMPDVSPDGLSLLFSTENNGGMYQATRASRNEPFGSVTSLGDLLPGQPAHQPSLSADGLTLFFTAWDTTGVQNDIYQATRTSLTAPWGNVVKLGAAINTPGYNDANPSISSDGLRLFFNSNRPGGFGQFDLYVATRTSADAPWQSAVNLGSQVNTAFDDKGANISADDTLLYFHSNRPGGLGADDIYRAPILGEAPSTISISDVSAREGSSTTQFIDAFVSTGTGGLDWPTDMTLGATGDVFVSSQLTNSVLRFERGTGTFIGAFVQSGSGGLNQPHGVAFGPDGNLYVASIGTNSVLAYNGSTGTFIKEFVTSQSAGLTIPKDITFGPDGNLYVPSRETDQILRFQGPGGASPGSPMGVFANTGSGSTPNHLAFGPDGNLYVGLPSFNTPTPFDAKIDRFNGSTGAFIDTFVTLGSGGIGDTREIIFDTSGNLYVADVSKDAVLRYQGPNGQTPGAFIDAFVPTGLGQLAKPIGIVFDADKNLLVAARDADSVLRYGPSSQAVFTVSLNAPAAAPVTVNYATTPGTAGASDFTATSGTVTFAAGQTSRTILVQTLDDAILEPNETFFVNLSNPVGATIADGQGIGTIFDNDTKFYVVDDASQNRTYEYGGSGQVGENSNLASGNSAPRGAASTVVGDKVWVVDANRNVYVYNISGGLVGSWTARTLLSNATPEGIATNGTDVWIVDAKNDRVYRYAGAASRTSGSQFAASSFPLNSSNTSPKDIVTDGQHLWVVNDSSTDRVFKYTNGGLLVGSWTIDSANKNPTGLTLDPANPQHIWIVDSGTDRVYQYTSAASRTSGSQTAASSFALAAGNTNPQGIADPPLAGDEPASTASSVAINFPSSSTSMPRRDYTPIRRMLHSAITNAPTSDELNLLARSNLAANRAIVDSNRWGSPVTSADAAVLDAALEGIDYNTWPEVLADI